MYLKGIQQTKECHASQDLILLKFKDFSDRMSKRIERDITPVLESKDQVPYSELIKSKKRKFEAAFPTETNDSLLSGGSSSRKKRIMNEVSNMSSNIHVYEEGIEYLVIHKPEFRKVEVHE